MAAADIEPKVSDHIAAYVELFERELGGRDLSDAERTALTRAFERRLRGAGAVKEKRLARRSAKRRFIVGGAFAVALIIVASMFVTYRPLKPMDDVHGNLEAYIEQVESGVGGNADDFYKLLDRFDRRIDADVVESYRTRMWEALDTRFDELVMRLKAGEIKLSDDAKKWAKLFPDRAERDARKDLVENATIDALGGSAKKFFGKAVETLKAWGEDVVEWIEEKTGDVEEASSNE